MKKFLNQLLALGVVTALVLVSCKKEGTKAVLSGDVKGGTLKASATTLVLQKATQDADAITFNFGEPDFGYQAASTNTLQLDVKGSNFSAAKEVSLGAKTTSKTYTGIDFNAILLSMNLPFDNSTDIEVRIKSVISPSVAPTYSNVLALNVKPYPLISYVYVPGDHQGWSPTTADSLTSATGNGVYKGIIYFPARTGASFKFKITPAKSWTVAYGDAGGGKVSTSGGDIQGPGAGSYMLTLDLNTLTLEFEKNSWGIIGNSTPGGWDNDTDLIYNNTTHVWSGTLALVPGVYKFRYNDAWGTNLGGKDGVLTPGGADIALATAGTYKVVLDVEAKTYTITKQ